MKNVTILLSVLLVFLFSNPIQAQSFTTISQQTNFIQFSHEIDLDQTLKLNQGFRFGSVGSVVLGGVFSPFQVEDNLLGFLHFTPFVFADGLYNMYFDNRFAQTDNFQYMYGYGVDFKLTDKLILRAQTPLDIKPIFAIKFSIK